ncbi:MAG TPA: CBS domain-containing protein [Burkholderiales bacterium]|nr:CBS domain-containing protein [Burkholderiales bacterium]
MEIPLRSLEQLAPFATAGELVAKRREPLIFVAPQASVLDALQLMADKHIGFLVVLENGKLAGVVSERDFARRVLLARLAPAEVTVREIMATRVHTVPPASRIPECIAVMHQHGVRHLPVAVDNRVAGVLSVRDLMGSLIERHERLLRRLQEERLTLLFPDPSSY